MARTELRSTQIKDEDLRIEDLFDFSPEAGTGLNLTIRAGRIRNDNTITDKSEQSILLTDDTTNFVEIDSVGVATSNTTGFTAGKLAVATVVTASGAITTITDKRTWVAMPGSGGAGIDGSGTANRIARFTDADTIGDAQISQDGTTGAITVLKALAPTVTALTDGANIATDASLGNDFRVTVAGDRTLSAPTNPKDGQVASWRIKASGANRTLTLDTGSGGFKFGSDITQITATVQDKADFILAKYILADTRWEVLAYVKGY